jgi:hypothetical protein
MGGPADGVRGTERAEAAEAPERLILTPAGVLHPRWQRDKAGEGMWVACKRDVVERLTRKKGEVIRARPYVVRSWLTGQALMWACCAAHPD